MRKYAFGKSKRLLTPQAFQAVFDDPPYRASHQSILILARPRADREPRLGLVIAKKNIRLATQRNRIKRLIRESFRLQQHQLQGLDVIVLARRGLDELDNPSIQQILDQQWRRITRKASATQRQTQDASQ